MELESASRIPRSAKPECGTIRAAWRHRRHGEPVDFACRVVHATYERERRERAAERSTVRDEALAVLAARHPTEFAQLMARITAERKQSQQVVDSPTGVG
jgi:hypothetical protein